MKKVLLIASMLLALGLVFSCSKDETPTEPAPPSGPMNPGGTLGVYADQAGTNQTITDPGAGTLVTVYVVHKSGVGVISSQFKVEAPAGWTYLGATSPFQVRIDNPQGGFEAGTSITYGTCMTGSIHVATVQYLAPGGSGGGVFRIVPNSAYPTINAVDCDLNLVTTVVGEDCPVN